MKERERAGARERRRLEETIEKFRGRRYGKQRTSVSAERNGLWERANQANEEREREEKWRQMSWTRVPRENEAWRRGTAHDRVPAERDVLWERGATVVVGLRRRERGKGGDQEYEPLWDLSVSKPDREETG